MDDPLIKFQEEDDMFSCRKDVQSGVNLTKEQKNLLQEMRDKNLQNWLQKNRHDNFLAYKNHLLSDANLNIFEQSLKNLISQVSDDMQDELNIYISNFVLEVDKSYKCLSEEAVSSCFSHSITHKMTKIRKFNEDLGQFIADARIQNNFSQEYQERAEKLHNRANKIFDAGHPASSQRKAIALACASIACAVGLALCMCLFAPPIITALPFLVIGGLYVGAITGMIGSVVLTRRSMAKPADPAHDVAITLISKFSVFQKKDNHASNPEQAVELASQPFGYQPQIA